MKERVTRALWAVHDAPQKSPVVYWCLGLAILGFAGFMVYREASQWKVWCGVGLLGLAVLPGVLPFVASNLQPLVALWKSSKNGTAGPPSGPSSL